MLAQVSKRAPRVAAATKVDVLVNSSVNLPLRLPRSNQHRVVSVRQLVNDRHRAERINAVASEELVKPNSLVRIKRVAVKRVVDTVLLDETITEVTAIAKTDVRQAASCAKTHHSRHDE